jgi:hypothetical protein
MSGSNKTTKSESPRLLTGGNPQIPKGDGDAAVQAYLQAMPGWKAPVGAQLDRMIVQTVPNVRKAVRWNTPFYGLEGQGWFTAFSCTTRYVKLAFFSGDSLNPQPPVESKVANVRYVHIHEQDVLSETLFTDWFLQASRLPGTPVF